MNFGSRDFGGRACGCRVPAGAPTQWGRKYSRAPPDERRGKKIFSKGWKILKCKKTSKWIEHRRRARKCIGEPRRKKGPPKKYRKNPNLVFSVLAAGTPRLRCGHAAQIGLATRRESSWGGRVDPKPLAQAVLLADAASERVHLLPSSWRFQAALAFPRPA